MTDASQAAIAELGKSSGPISKAKLAALAILGAVAVAAPLAERWEGYVARSYRDPAEILTVCYGETEGIEDRIYSKDECAAKLRARMARDYAPPILACVPGFIEPARKFAFAAALDASYNAGPAAVCGSPMARGFNSGDWRRGCANFAGWYTTARNRRTGVRKVLPGLVKRREAERVLCLKGLS